MTATSIAERREMVAALPYPTKRDEAWRYAPHKVLAALTFDDSVSEGAVATESLSGQIPALDGPRIVLVGGVVDVSLSRLDALPTGLTLITFEQARSETPELLEAHFAHDDEHPLDTFAALNQAFGEHGAVIDVADGQTIDTPIQIVDLALADVSGNASSSGVVIRLGARASATVVETRLGEGESGGSNVRTTTTIGDNANLRHIVLQDMASTQVHLGSAKARLGAASILEVHLFNLGARYGRFGYDVVLAGDGATAELNGLYFGAGDQILDQQINAVHDAPNCTSRQSFRGILDNESTGVFNGGIDVRPGADGTDAEQSNNNLLLSDRAEANTQPRLEILADEVACKHGATVGQLDADALYYMRTRGIPTEDARRLLIQGFADQAVDALEDEVLRNWILERLRDDG